MPVPSTPFVSASDADGCEPHLLVHVDRPLVGDGRIDGEAMVPADLDEPAGEREQRIGPEPRPTLCEYSPMSMLATR